MSEEFEGPHGHDTDYPILLLLFVFFYLSLILENVHLVIQGMSQEKQIIINMIFSILKVVCIFSTALLIEQCSSCGSGLRYSQSNPSVRPSFSFECSQLFSIVQTHSRSGQSSRESVESQQRISRSQ